MGQPAHPAASGLAAWVTQIHAVSGGSFLVALPGGITDHQYAGALRPVVGEGGLPIPGGKAPGSIGASGFSNRQIHKGGVRRNQVQPCFTAHAASTGSLGAGYSCRVIDSRSLRPSKDLNKSLSVCSGERKYFSGASGIKISDNIDPSP